MKRDISTKAEKLRELKSFISAIGDIPVCALVFDEDGKCDDFEELADMCMDFVSEARDKMQEIAFNHKLNVKKTWIN